MDNQQQSQQQPVPFTGQFEFTEETGSNVPAGNYLVAFAGAELIDTEFGRKLRLKWTVTQPGEHQGETASTLCGFPGPGKKLNPAYTLYQFACSFLGRQLAEGERFDLNQFVGMPGSVIVSPTQTGKGTKVTAFLPQQAQQPIVQQPQIQQPVAPQPQQPAVLQPPPANGQQPVPQPGAYSAPVQPQQQAQAVTEQQATETF